MTIRSGLLGLSVSLGIVGMGHVAAAQDAAASAARRGLIDQAQQARTGNNHEQALDLAERAAHIQMSPSLRLFIAQEQNSLNRLAEAYGNADLCMREAEADTATRNREQIAATCRSLAQELRGRVGRVTVTVPSPAPAGLHVVVANNALSDALIGVPYVVSPGHIVVEATATGYAPFRREVDVTAGANADVAVQLTRQPGSTTTTTASSASPTPGTGGGTTTPNHGSSGPGIAPFIVMGGGVLVAGAGVLFLVLQQSEQSNASSSSGCPGFDCTTVDAGHRAYAQSHLSTAGTWNALGITGVAVGGAAIVGGLVWFLAGRSSGSADHAAMLDVVPTEGGLLLGIHGAM